MQKHFGIRELLNVTPSQQSTTGLSTREGVGTELLHWDQHPQQHFSWLKAAEQAAGYSASLTDPQQNKARTGSSGFTPYTFVTLQLSSRPKLSTVQDVKKYKEHFQIVDQCQLS